LRQTPPPGGVRRSRRSRPAKSPENLSQFQKNTKIIDFLIYFRQAIGIFDIRIRLTVSGCVAIPRAGPSGTIFRPEGGKAEVGFASDNQLPSDKSALTRSGAGKKFAVQGAAARRAVCAAGEMGMPKTTFNQAGDESAARAGGGTVVRAGGKGRVDGGKDRAGDGWRLVLVAAVALSIGVGEVMAGTNPPPTVPNPTDVDSDWLDSHGRPLDTGTGTATGSTYDAYYQNYTIHNGKLYIWHYTYQSRDNSSGYIYQPGNKVLKSQFSVLSDRTEIHIISSGGN
jgi:hypothetical protein